MNINYKYDAFITYRHLSPDKPIAEKLQKLLEGYVPPKGIGQKGRRLHLFRDQTELPTSDDLGASIRETLAQSRYLIVVCSAETEKSRWCMEEIEFFKSLHGYSNKNILTLLCSSDGTVTFPETLRFETVMVEDNYGFHAEKREIEPLAANVSAPTLKESIKKLKTEYLRLAAALYGCSYDELYRRDQRRQNRRRFTSTISIVATLSIISLASIAALFTIGSKNAQIENDVQKLNIDQAKLLAKESQELSNAGDEYGALNAALQSLDISEQNSVPLQNDAIDIAANLSGAYTGNGLIVKSRYDQKAIVKKAALLNGGKRFFSSDSSNSYLWDTETGKIIKTYKLAASDVGLYLDNTLDSGNIINTEYNNLAYIAKGNFIMNRNQRFFPDGKKATQHAIYYIDNKKRCICKLNPEDGSNFWEYEYIDKNDYSCKIKDVSEDGVLVETDKNIFVLSASDGKLLASANTDDIAKKFGEKSSFGFIFHYQNNCLLVYYSKNNNKQIHLYNRDKSGFKLLWSKKTELNFKGLAADDQKYSYDPKFYITEDRILLAATSSEGTGEFSRSIFQVLNKKTGEPVCTLNSDKLTMEGSVFLGIIKKGAKGIDNNFAVAIFGNHFIVVNSDNGNTITDMFLPNNVVNMRISQEGYVFFIDKEGYDFFVHITDLLNKDSKFEKQTNVFFCNRKLSLELENADRCNGVYAILDSSGTTITLFRFVKNENAKPFNIEKKADTANYVISYKLSPNKTRALVKTDNKTELLILDAKTNSIERTLSIGSEYVNNIYFISEDILAVSSSESIHTYDLNTGKLIKEIKYSDIQTTYAVCSEPGKLYYYDPDKKLLYEYDGKSEPKMIFDSVEKGYNSINELYISSDGSCIVMKVSDEQYTDKIISITPEGNEIATFATQDKKLEIKSTCWSPDGNEIRMIINKRVYCFDCKTGESAILPEHDCEIINLIDIDGSLCLLDSKSNLIKIEKNGDEFNEAETIDLGIIAPNSYGDFSYTSYSEEAGLIHYKNLAWIIDKNSFEYFTNIRNYTGISPDTKEIITYENGDLVSFPILSQAEIHNYAKGILIQADEEE